MRAMVTRDTKGQGRLQRPRRELFRCRVALPREICLSPLHASFAKVDDLATCRAKAEFRQLSCPFGAEESSRNQASCCPTVGWWTYCSPCIQNPCDPRAQGVPDPEPPPGAIALDRPRRIKLCGGLFLLMQWNTGAQGKVCPGSKLFPLYFYAAGSDSFDRPASFFSSGDAGSPSSLPVEQPQNKRKHDADKNPGADRSTNVKFSRWITTSPGNLPRPTRDNQGHNRLMATMIEPNTMRVLDMGGSGREYSESLGWAHFHCCFAVVAPQFLLVFSCHLRRLVVGIDDCAKQFVHLGVQSLSIAVLGELDEQRHSPDRQCGNTMPVKAILAWPLQMLRGVYVSSPMRPNAVLLVDSRREYTSLI